MDVSMLQLPPGDPGLIDKIVCQLKSNGIFDQFRKECIADVDTKPAYQNLRQRVEGSVSSFLSTQEWKPDLNKNQLRDSLRKHIHESGFLDIGVERIVDQVVNPKMYTVFFPKVEDVVYGFLGLEKPKRSTDAASGVHFGIPRLGDSKPEKKFVSLKDLLPTDLDPISPEKLDSDEGDMDEVLEQNETSQDGKSAKEAGSTPRMKDEEVSRGERKAEEDEEEDEEEEEEEASPPFESLDVEAQQPSSDAGPKTPMLPHSADMLDNITSSSSSSSSLEVKDSLMQYGGEVKVDGKSAMDTVGDASLDEGGKNDMRRSEGSRNEHERNDNARSESGRTDSVRSESKRNEISRTEERKNESGRNGISKSSSEGRGKGGEGGSRKKEDEERSKRKKEGGSGSERRDKSRDDEHKRRGGERRDSHHHRHHHHSSGGGSGGSSGGGSGSSKRPEGSSRRSESKEDWKKKKDHQGQSSSSSSLKEKDKGSSSSGSSKKASSGGEKSSSTSHHSSGHSSHHHHSHRSGSSGSSHRHGDKDGKVDGSGKDKSGSASSSNKKKASTTDDHRYEREKKGRDGHHRWDRERSREGRGGGGSGDGGSSKQSGSAANGGGGHSGGGAKGGEGSGGGGTSESIEDGGESGQHQEAPPVSVEEREQSSANSGEQANEQVGDREPVKEPVQGKEQAHANEEKHLKEQVQAKEQVHEKEHVQGKEKVQAKEKEKVQKDEKVETKELVQVKELPESKEHVKGKEHVKTKEHVKAKDHGKAKEGAQEKEHTKAKEHMKAKEHVEGKEQLQTPVSVDAPALPKVKKPKIAANIYEVRKIMEERKRLERKEMERRASEVVVPVKKEAPESPMEPEVDVEDDVLFLEEQASANAMDFVSYVHCLSREAESGDFSHIPLVGESEEALRLLNDSSASPANTDFVELSDVEVSREEEEVLRRLGALVERSNQDARGSDGEGDRAPSEPASSAHASSGLAAREEEAVAGSGKRPRRPNPRYNSGEYSTYSDEERDLLAADQVSEEDESVEESGTGRQPVVFGAGCCSSSIVDCTNPVVVLNDIAESASQKKRRGMVARRLGVRGPLRRVTTPDAFVMPLSPESDVSTASGDAGRKALLISKESLADSELMPEDYEPESRNRSLLMTTETEGYHAADTESLRSEGVVLGSSQSEDGDHRRQDESLSMGPRRIRGTRSSSRVQQRYSSDDLYKPRPNITLGRRNRGKNSPTQEDTETGGLMEGDGERGSPSVPTGSEEGTTSSVDMLPNKKRRR